MEAASSPAGGRCGHVAALPSLSSPPLGPQSEAKAITVMIGEAFQAAFAQRRARVELARAAGKRWGLLSLVSTRRGAGIYPSPLFFFGATVVSEPVPSTPQPR